MPQPDLILTPFAQDAPPSAVDPIPESRSPSDPLEKASWTQGFPGLTMIPLAAGGIPPRGQDFNGVLKAISEHTVFQGGGGQYKWSAEYVAANGGYSVGAVIQSDDGLSTYVSAVDGNTINFNTTPGSIGVEWLAVGGSSKADSAIQIAAGIGLSGGGNLTANRTLSVVYGTTAGTAAQGDDPRIGALPSGYFYGFTMSNNVGSPTTTIDVASGSARNLLDTLDIKLASALTGILQTSGSWAAGTGQNKLDTGARANNQTYHVFAIRRTSDGAGDILFSLSPTAPTMPSGYAGFRRIGSVLTDGTSAVKSFIQDGDEFLLTSPVIDVNATGVAAGTLNYAISVPVGIVVKAIVQGSVQTSVGASFYHINTPGNNDVSTNNCATAVTTGVSLPAAFGRVYIRTNTSAQIQVNSQSGSNTHRFASYGWVDRRDA